MVSNDKRRHEPAGVCRFQIQPIPQKTYLTFQLVPSFESSRSIPLAASSSRIASAAEVELMG
jgi:hypothetical protein